MKKCSKCNVEKELKFFKKESRRLSGYASSCKKCAGEYERERRRSKNPLIPDCKTCSSCNVELFSSLFSRHSGMKDGLSHNCKKCASVDQAKWYAENSERKKKSVEDWARKNKSRKKQNDKNRQEKNPEIFSHYTGLRRSRKINATPEWLTEKHFDEIKKFYWMARDAFLISGQEYEVDHIIPLKGKNICGLHVPWNLQILPKDINRKKSNKYES